MNRILEFQTLEYLNLEVKTPENYNLSKRITSDKDKLVCCFKDNFKHKLHSNSNSENFEQLNTITDLICNLSENLKTKLNKENTNLDKSTNSSKSFDQEQSNKNLGYLKQLLEDIFTKTKEESKELKNLLTINKNIEIKLTENNNLLEEILYGKSKQRT